MKKCHKKLEEIIKDVVLLDVEDYIDDLFETIANEKSATPQMKEDLEEMQEMKKEFEGILVDISNKALTNEECEELFDEITQMVNNSEE